MNTIHELIAQNEALTKDKEELLRSGNDLLLQIASLQERIELLEEIIDAALLHEGVHYCPANGKEYFFHGTGYISNENKRLFKILNEMKGTTEEYEKQLSEVRASGYAKWNAWKLLNKKGEQTNE